MVNGLLIEVWLLWSYIAPSLSFQTLAALHRQLRLLTPLYNVRDPNKKEKAHPRVIFLFNDMLVVSEYAWLNSLNFLLCGSQKPFLVN